MGAPSRSWIQGFGVCLVQPCLWRAWISVHVAFVESLPAPVWMLKLEC